MDFTTGLLTGIYVVIAIIVSYVAYIIEVKLDLPAIFNGRSNSAISNNTTTDNNPNSANSNTNSNSNNENQHQNDLADISQTRLRQLIEAIIAETLQMPGLLSSAVSEISLNTRSASATPLTNGLGAKRRHRVEQYFEPSNYQDLLATAVLNKIIVKENNTRRLSESTPDMIARNIDANFNVENQSTTSGSSVEPRSDFSYTDTEQQLINDGDNANTLETILSTGRESMLSDYIAEHMVPLPDITATAIESDEDDFASGNSSTLGEGTWEDNWLFKKKHNSMNHQITSGGVGMLVPAPKDDIRCQIGDKMAEEVSDLSEINSDTDDASLDLQRNNVDPPNDRLLNKQLIGGQNTKMVLDELIECASMISSTSPAENEPKFTETKNENVVGITAKTEAINSHLKELDTNILPPNVNPLTGSIAEREYKKWNNAVDMPNNPYAPEALKKRISGSEERFIDLPNISPSREQSPIALLGSADENTMEQDRECDYKRYERDYYINNNKQASVSRSRSPTTSASPNTAFSDEPSTDNIVINEPIMPATQLYQALPAQVVEEPMSIETLSSNQSLQSTPTTTSDDSDTVRIYNFNKQETTIIRDTKATATATETKNIVTAAGSLQTADTQSTSLEEMSTATDDATTPKETPKNITPKTLKARPTELSLGAASTNTTQRVTTPTRGATPTAFKFLQPKRKLIEPSQVLSFDDEEPQEPTTPAEKPVIEEEIVHALPSVKALAQVFLMTSSKSAPIEKRWVAKAKAKAAAKNQMNEPNKPIPNKKLSLGISLAEIADEACICTDAEEIQTAVTSQQVEAIVEEQAKDLEATASTKATTPTVIRKKKPSPLSAGFLKSNIAFFENLKFK